jgi:hypothetical protein
MNSKLVSPRCLIPTILAPHDSVRPLVADILVPVSESLSFRWKAAFTQKSEVLSPDWTDIYFGVLVRAAITIE